MDKIAVSVVEAASALGVGRTTAYELIGTGKLKTFKLGRRTCVTVASIRDLVAELSGEVRHAA